MGRRLAELTGINPFALDQTPSVEFGDHTSPVATWVETYEAEIDLLGGVAGFLAQEAPPRWPLRSADAFLLATDNALT